MAGRDEMNLDLRILRALHRHFDLEVKPADNLFVYLLDFVFYGLRMLPPWPKTEPNPL